MIKVFIIDDHAVVRAGLKAMLPAEGDIEVVGELPDGENAAEAISKSGADVVLLDVRMPVKNGLDVLDELKTWKVDVGVIMLTTSEGDNDIYEAVRRGAKGYVVKDRDAEDVYKAIREVASGGTFYPETIKKLYAEREKTEGLSLREMDVLELLAKGLSTVEIADTLELSRDTIKTYSKSLYLKLGVNDRVSAVSEAYRRGFLHMDR